MQVSLPAAGRKRMQLAVATTPRQSCLKGSTFRWISPAISGGWVIKRIFIFIFEAVPFCTHTLIHKNHLSKIKIIATFARKSRMGYRKSFIDD